MSDAGGFGAYKELLVALNDCPESARMEVQRLNSDLNRVERQMRDSSDIAAQKRASLMTATDNVLDRNRVLTDGVAGMERTLPLHVRPREGSSTVDVGRAEREYQAAVAYFRSAEMALARLLAESTQRETRLRQYNSEARSWSLLTLVVFPILGVILGFLLGWAGAVGISLLAVATAFVKPNVLSSRFAHQLRCDPSATQPRVLTAALVLVIVAVPAVATSVLL